MRKDVFFIASVLWYSNYSQAEVLDKCPTFVNKWVESEGAWSLLSPSEGVVRLVQFSAIYVALGVLLYFVIRKVRHTLLKYIPAALTVMIALYLAMEFIPRNESCSHSFWLKEMPEHLRWIQLGFDTVLLTVPLLLSLALASKNRN